MGKIVAPLVTCSFGFVICEWEAAVFHSGPRGARILASNCARFLKGNGTPAVVNLANFLSRFSEMMTLRSAASFRSLSSEDVGAEELTAQCDDDGGYHDAVNHGTLPAVADRDQFERMLAHVHFGLRNGTIVEAKLPDPHQFWLERFDPERLGVEPFESRRAMQTAFANFVANRRR